MKKLLLLLMSLLFVLAVNAGHADAVPDIRGEYSGSYTTVVSNCTDSSSNGTYYAVLAMSIPTQTGDIFSGSATGTFEDDGLTVKEYIQLSGTIAESGQISGNTSHTFLGTGGEGTFTGQLSGITLSIENPGHDTYGETCTYRRYMSATRKPTIFKLVTTANDSAYFKSVSISGEFAIVGTRWDSDFAYIFQRSGSSWNQVAKLTADDVATGDNFGESVSISDGYAIVGESTDSYNLNSSGSAHIFERSGSSWNQVAKITASDGDLGDNFGSSVSISGNYAIVGAQSDKSRPAYGSAYLFERSGSNWNQVAKLIPDGETPSDYFGRSVSISGGYAIVGAPSTSSESGSAYIFERNDSSWNQVVKLTPSDVDTRQFGWSVSISGDYAIVGASPWGDRKSAYIFERSGNSWNQVANLTGDTYFGLSVSISGGYAIVGAPRGGALIFERSSSSWTQLVKLTASDANFSSVYQVSISGRYAIVAGDGAAYIFDLFIPNYVDEDVDEDVDKVTVLPMPWIPLLLLDD